MSRPAFFISSTVYDFRDMRSALKFCLEEQGAQVYASEFNDFPKPVDTHSYNACLAALGKADYFILLIGTRVGGWFDADQKISITQQEYREAYKLHKAGKLKILSFIRSEVWQFHEQRKELEKLLSEQDVDPGVSNSIVNAPSKFASDAQFLTSFINEVGRNAETKKALKTRSPLPTGNWIHTFTNFRDIWDVIQTQVLSGVPLDELALRKLLSRELTEILKISLVKLKNHVYSPLDTIKRFHSEHQVTLEGCGQNRTIVSQKRWNSLSILGIHLLGTKLQTQVLDRALETAYFLEFDRESNTFVETAAYKGLFLLQQEIRALNRANTTDTLSVIFDNSPASRNVSGETIDIQTMKLLPLLHVLDRWANVVQLSSSILKHLHGADFTMPYLRPRSPISGMNEQLEQEAASEEDVLAFLES